jgi:DNA invertase Pin-like site-specific DNA recombinase
VELLSRRQKAPIKIMFADMPFANLFMIGIMAQVAQWEREEISKRTRAALQVAKARGTTIGGDRGNPAGLSPIGRPISAARRTEAAKVRAAKNMPHIRQARADGFRSFKAVAGYLKRKGIRTTRGLVWRPATVRRLEVGAKG